MAGRRAVSAATFWGKSYWAVSLRALVYRLIVDDDLELIIAKVGDTLLLEGAACESSHIWGICAT